MKNTARKGFTLIEILIVVAIIAILASVVLVGLGPTQQSGRDARRLSDLHEVQNGLELYYNKCGYYPGDVEASSPCNQTPVHTDGYGDQGAPTGNHLTAVLPTSVSGISSIPNDPSGGHQYYYVTGATPSNTYVLGATLENAGNAVFTSYTPPSLPPNPVGDTNLLTSCASPNYCVSL